MDTNWEFDNELPTMEEEEDPVVAKSNRFESMLNALSTSRDIDVETPVEARPFEDFAFHQGGAAKTSISSVKVVVIVHVNGIHRLPIRWCRCPGHKPYNIQALDAGFFATSYKRIGTLFTFGALDDFLADNQECKTAAWHYIQKLRRFTCPAFPHTSPVCVFVGCF